FFALTASPEPSVSHRAEEATPLISTKRDREEDHVEQSLKLKTEEAAPVAVIALQRYLSEQTKGQQLDSYSYDVTVTDGVWRAKCFLHPSLNHLVHSNSLKTGSEISITQCSFVYNERRLGHGYICIEQLRCAAKRSAVLARVNTVSSLPILVKQGMERSVVLQSDVPLQVSRKHYLSLWNNDDPEGDIWISGSPSADTVLDVSKVTLLSSLDSSFKNTWKPLPLLVKIIHKSRLRYYGKFGLKIDYPYQAYFEVADQSGTMSLVLWNELCPEFYQRLNVGTVLYLQNYTLKQSYSNRSRPQMDHHRMKTFNSVEICLNPRNPASVITVVSPKSILPQWGLPDISYQFTARSELEKLANNSACDIIGLVTFVGRVERVKSKGKEKYWTYRWVHAVDGTSDHPFILELFSTSQAEIFSHICPMTYLVCTQMRVCHVEGSLPYLTSSCETETFITGYHKGQPYVNDPRVKSFIQWTKTLKDNVVLQKTAVGGYYPYIVFQIMCYIPLVAAADLKRELETLQYREHKKLAIQGQIAAVQYMETPEPQGLKDKEVNDLILNRLPKSSYSNDLSWESSSWVRQQQEVSEHLCKGGLWQDSICRRFTLDEKNVLLQWSNLQPTRWTPLRTADALSPVLCPGYYHVTILGINKQIAVDAMYIPVVSSSEPQAVGLPQDPHGNTMLSCLSSGFLCPLSNTANNSEETLPRPGSHCGGDNEILATASELEDTHVVCILDLCHLGGDKVEVMISKVYSFFCTPQ
uniref:RPA1 related single stranded DNA binding protein n=1 Tax=Pundamilia nyererei TaxID=303518 RepID=A0A3B4H4A5_9CICH